MRVLADRVTVTSAVMASDRDTGIGLVSDTMICFKDALVDVEKTERHHTQERATKDTAKKSLQIV